MYVYYYVDIYIYIHTHIDTYCTYVHILYACVHMYIYVHGCKCLSVLTGSFTGILGTSCTAWGSIMRFKLASEAGSHVPAGAF